MRDRIGHGEHTVAWFNRRAKQVTPKVLRAFGEHLPKAHVYAADTLDDARRDAKHLARHLPELLFVGGGDGTIVTLLNLLREAGVTRFPTLAFLKLGTGNGWPTETGAQSYPDTLTWLARLPRTPPTRHFDLLDAEGRLCQFFGSGWDATVLHDYKKNLERRASQLVGGKLAATTSKGVGGYVYSILRHTVPGEAARLKEFGRNRVVIRALGKTPLVIDKEGVAHPSKRKDGVVWRGPMGFIGAGTEPLWGGRARAYPYAQLRPGMANLRVFDRSVFQAVRYGIDFWLGRHVPGMHDFLVDHARIEFNHPMPWQVGGDVVGIAEAVEFRVDPQGVEVVDWPRAHQVSGPLD